MGKYELKAATTTPREDPGRDGVTKTSCGAGHRLLRSGWRSAGNGCAKTNAVGTNDPCRSERRNGKYTGKSKPSALFQPLSSAPTAEPNWEPASRTPRPNAKSHTGGWVCSRSTHPIRCPGTGNRESKLQELTAEDPVPSPDWRVTHNNANWHGSSHLIWPPPKSFTTGRKSAYAEAQNVSILYQEFSHMHPNT